MNILGIFRFTQGCIGIQLLFKRQLVLVAINPNIQIQVNIGIVYWSVGDLKNNNNISVQYKLDK